jgi:hypothetical protein
MHCGTAVSCAFELTLIDKPARSQLHAAIGLGIVRRGGPFGEQRICDFCSDNRVFEEATGIAKIPSKVGSIFQKR